MQDGMDRLAGVRVQDHEGARARVLYKAGGCGRVVVLVCRREWWPHDIRDDSRGGWLSGLLRGGICHDRSPASWTIWARVAQSWFWMGVPVRPAVPVTSMLSGGRPRWLARFWFACIPIDDLLLHRSRTPELREQALPAGPPDAGRRRAGARSWGQRGQQGGRVVAAVV